MPPTSCAPADVLHGRGTTASASSVTVSLVELVSFGTRLANSPDYVLYHEACFQHNCTPGGNPLGSLYTGAAFSFSVSLWFIGYGHLLLCYTLDLHMGFAWPYTLGTVRRHNFESNSDVRRVS